jgi:hypothetical protein
MKKFLSVAAVVALIFALSVPAFADTPSVEYTVTATVNEETVQTETPAEQVKALEEESSAGNLGDLQLPEGVSEKDVYLEVKAITKDNDNTLTTEEHTALVEAVQDTLTESIQDVTQSVQKQVDAGVVKGVESKNDKGETLKEVKVTDVAVTLAEVNLKYKDDAGNDVDVSAENFPEGGLKVAIAYGELSNGQAVLDVLRLVGDKWESVGADNFSYDASGVVNVTFDHLCSVAFVIGTVEAVYAPADEAEEPADDQGKTDKDTAGAGAPAKADPSKSPQTGYDVFGWAAAVSALVLAAGYFFVSARKVTE